MPRSSSRTSSSLREKTAPQALKRSPHLRFYLYSVVGTYRDKPQTFRVVCCHASDARAMVIERLPEIDNVRVKRGMTVHLISVGDHALHD